MNEHDLIQKYLGVRYMHKGRDLNGLDCWGLILSVYTDLGFTLWDINEDYDRNWSFSGKNYFIENYHRQWRLVVQPRLFDVVLFSSSRGVINHAGVMLSNERFIHACRAGVVINSMQGKFYQRFSGYYRLKEYDSKIHS